MKFENSILSLLMLIQTGKSLCDLTDDNNATDFNFDYWNYNQVQEYREYNYNFDFDTALTKGVAPSWLWINNSSIYTIFGLKSSPGCPEPFEDNPWLLYGNPARCYLSGYQWPCNDNMKLLPQSTSHYGYCDCNCNDYDGRIETAPKLFCDGQTSDGKERVLVYRNKLDACQPLFEKGNCSRDAWLVLSDNPLKGPYCERRRCPEVSDDSSSFNFYDYQTGLCIRHGESCGFDKLYQLTARSWIPQCLELASGGGPTSIIQNDCPAGQKFSSLAKRCVPRCKNFCNTIG